MRAEQQFKKDGDKRDEIYARVGLIRAQSQSGGIRWVDVSRMLGQELELPATRDDPKLRLWCLAAKGYTDLEINPDSARRDWTEARKIAKSLGEVQWEIRATGELGTIAFLDGHSIRAGQMVGDALLSAVASGDMGEEVRSLEMLGNGFYEVKRYRESELFFSHAIKVSDETPDEGFPFMAYEGKSQALAGEGRLREASEVLDSALAVARENGNIGHETEILVVLGELALHRGDRKSATGYWEQAGAIGTTHSFYRPVEQAMLHLADLYREEGDLGAAEKSASVGVDAGMRVGDRYLLPWDLTVLADLKASDGHVAQANALYEQAEDVVDGMLVDLDEPYWSSSLAGAMSRIYTNHFELLARTGHVARAFDVLERVRGRTAAALLENRVSFRKDESSAAQALDARVSDLQLQLMRSNSPKDRERLKEELFEVERELAWTKNDQEASLHEWLEKPAALKRVEEVLRRKELVLEYVLAEPKAYCFWVTRDRAGLTLLPAGSRRIEELAREYVAAIRAKRDDIPAARELYTILLSPVSVQAAHDQLIVVPDGFLYFLPFGVLRDSANSFLVESRTISYVPAATVLEFLRSRNEIQQASRSFLGIGDVAYQDQGDLSAELPKPDGFEQTLVRGFSDLFGATFHDLPQTRQEVLEANEILGDKGVVLLGRKATVTAFESEALANFRVIHFAVHGFADSNFPERSGLVLSMDPSMQNNGLLRISDIMRLRLNADLVTLSACDTGLGKVEGEEGITNLAEAFLVSGARAVVASLWSADDTFTSDLMKRFYTHIAEGQETSTALRLAELDLLAKYGRNVPPYYWGAFILVGDGGSPVQPSAQ